MEFVINTDLLKKEVNLLQGVTEKKSGINALSNILIESIEEGIQLTATDLDYTIRATLKADVKTEGNLCVSAKKLSDIVKSLKDGQIKFKKQTNEWVQVTCNSSKFRVAGLAREYFPTMPEVEDNEVILDGDDLKSLIAHTCFAVTNEDSRFALNGAKLEVANGKAKMIATDGHRIAFMEVEIDDIEANLDILIPKKALTELVKFIGNEVVITQNDNHIKFVSDERIFISRRLALAFPDYTQAMPKANAVELNFDGEELVTALRRNAIMADEKSSAVKIELSKEKMVLTSSSVGESEETVKCTTLNLPDEGLTFHINWLYLVEYLNICDTPLIKLKDATSAIEVIDGTSKCVIMPLRPSGAK